MSQNKKRPAALFRFLPFSRKQKQILTWWCAGSPVRDSDGIIADGAIRSGKTVCMSLSYVMWAMDCFNGQNFAICGKTIGSLRRNVIGQLLQMLASRGYLADYRRAENYITVSYGKVQNTFYLFGGKDESSQDLIQGITLAGAFFDEVVLMPESFVNQATARCSVTGSKWWFNCNPGNPQHWFHVKWVLQCRDKHILYLHFTMDDNLTLSSDIKTRYKTMYLGVFYDRYIRGLWVAAEGVIYRMFADSLAAHDTRFLWPTDKPLRPWRLHIGVDFGGTGSHHAFVATAALPGYAGVVVVASRRLDPHGTDADHLADTFLEFAEAVFARWGEIHAVFCDSAEQVLIQQIISALRRSRFAWLAPRVHNAAKIEINDRIRLTSILMGGGRFWYLPEAASLRDAMATALWAGKHPGKDERLDDGTTDIDSLDAFEYTIERDYKRYLRMEG